MNERVQMEQQLKHVLGMGGFEQKSQVRFDAVAGIMRGLESGLISEWERREPIKRERSISADFTLPLLRSVMTGGFFGPIAAGLSGDIAAGAWVFSLASAGSWLLQMIGDSRLNWRIERLVGRDLDGDGHIGQTAPLSAPQQPSVRTVRVEHVERTANNHWRLRWSNIPEWLTDDKLGALAQLCIGEDANFSRRGVAAAITQDEYPLLIETFQAERFIFGQGKGYILTGSGRRFLRRFLDE